MRRIALVNQKGGVGKTTTAVNLSAAIARLDRRVLLVDLDPQSNATVSLGIPPDQQKNTTYALLNGGPFEPLKLSDNFHLVPSNIELAGAEMELTSVIGREIVLRDALADIKGYDFVILDCSPSLGLLSVNALTTAKEVMVPLQCEFLALHGISLLIRTVDLVRKRLNPELSITGVIPCMYDARKGLARDVVVEIEKHFGSKVFKSKIRSNVRLAEAPSHGKTIFDYAPDSFGAEDYLALAREIVGIQAIQRETAPQAVPAEPAPPVILPPDLEIPIPVPELVVAGGMSEAAAPVVDVPPQVQALPAPAVESYSSAPMAERYIPAADPVVAAPPPLMESYRPIPVAEPMVEAHAPVAQTDSPAPVTGTMVDVAPAAEYYVPAPAPEPIAPAPLAESYSPTPVAEPMVDVAPVAEHDVPAPAPDPIAPPPLAESYSPLPVAEPIVEAPPPVVETYPPAPVAPPIVDVAAVADPYLPAPAPELVATPPLAESYTPEPVVDAAPVAEPYLPAPELISPPEPVAQAPMLDIVSDGVVEFIELIPLEIEELPYIEPERTA